MPLNNFFTASELAREIETGESSVRFWLSRFSRWLPHVIDQGQKLYTQESLSTLLVIAENINSDMLPTGIETLLEDRAFNALKKAGESKKETVEKKSLDLIESFLGTMITLQERIANTQERMAGAEEKKALAMEQRAETEEKKLLAMKEIATALQGMNQGGLSRTTPEQKFEMEESQAIAQDDLSQLPAEEPEKQEPLDNLSLLVEQEPPLDDLAMLLDDMKDMVEEREDLELDDLALLVEEEQEPLDDLAMLVDNMKDMAKDTEDIELDDLSLLIGEEQAPMDNLSLLAEDQDPLDEFVMLLDDLQDKDKESGNIGIDDIGMLVEEKQNLKPSIKPEDNFELYKSEIINIIIQLKNEGLSVEETTDRFNSDGVLTFSGKSPWNSKSIAQIYKFINAVKK